MRWLRPALGLAVAALIGYEGFVSQPYQDQAGVWTNGYGNTFDVGPQTPPVSEPEARAQLEKHVPQFQTQLDGMFSRPVGPYATVAYTSLAYNIGLSALRKSTVVRRHNAGDLRGACDAILMWDKITVHGQLVHNKGLAARRASERAMCLKDIP